jgi:hypothetical protein
MNREKLDKIIEMQHKHDDRLYVYHNAKSVELIQYSAKRGMSRNAMRRIWSDRLLNLVLGHENDKN